MIAGAATSNRDAFELEEGNDERCADGEPSLGSISAYEYSDQPKWLAGIATIRLIRLLFTMIALEPAQWIAELAMWLGKSEPRRFTLAGLARAFLSAAAINTAASRDDKDDQANVVPLQRYTCDAASVHDVCTEQNRPVKPAF